MITLEQKHIDHLYDFVRRHFVPYYDLQTELVDHLASGIEKLSEEHPGKSFEQLLDIEFRKFGVHGFEDVVAKRANALSKEYYRLALERVAGYFKWPVILQSLFYGVLCYFTLTVIDSQWLPMAFYVFIIAVAIAGVVRLWRQKKQRERKYSRKWLLQEIIFNGGGGGVAILQLPLQLLLFFVNHGSERIELLWFRLLVAVSVVVLFRIVQVVCWVIPDQIDSILEERYKTYKFSD
ncbi:hypothetical protein [Robertkochia sediminum]|uniref:hypothetical protein n=1 Tax=Robertkochia sediminum TaxID=2785326 RepID=UPI0019328D58|nr:hypothetical protein [Robertkochia sediminum]MBL7471773.1 hypothetical protein [Robertkochia sediminum]